MLSSPMSASYSCTIAATVGSSGTSPEISTLWRSKEGPGGQRMQALSLYEGDRPQPRGSPASLDGRSLVV